MNIMNYFKRQKSGFIQIPILIAIIAGILTFGGASYTGVKLYQNYKVKEMLEAVRNSEVENLRREVEELKSRDARVIIKEVPAQKAEGDLSTIVQRWRPRIAFIDCKFVIAASNTEAGRQTGSGYIFGADTVSGDIIILTNNHVLDIVINDIYGKPTSITATPTSCDIKIPGDTQSVTVHNVSLNSKERTPFAGSSKEDFGIITIKNPTQYMKYALGNFGEPACDKKAKLGEKILIFGYPGIGDRNDITVTDGIVSGYDGNYYITSAKVDHGNSGGVAVSIENNCYLGIPTFAQAGTIESLARVLDIHVIF